MKANRFLTLGLLAALLAGCADPPAPNSLWAHASPSPGLATQTGASSRPAIGFGELAKLLAGTVDEQGVIDPTALAIHLPRLERQLALLAQPWPAEIAGERTGGDERLAWLYNARAAWSLRIVASELAPRPRQPDLFALPTTIRVRKLLEQPITLNGQTTTLAAIDRELARDKDFRLAAAAPCATDFFGRLPREPFTGLTVRAAAAQRFRDYLHDPNRVVVDHDYKRLRVPPALWQFVPLILADYDQRYASRGVQPASALAEFANVPDRQRMQDATGYPAVERQTEAGIVARQDLPTRGEVKLFGP